MINQLHSGLTVNPDDILPNGSQEIGIRELLLGRHPFGTVCKQLAYKQKRARLQRMCAERRWSLPDKDSESLLAELLEIVRERKQLGTVVSVLAPWYEDNTLSHGEGYIRRIMEADERILSDLFCIYFYECPYYRVSQIVADRISDNRIYIRYNANYTSQRTFVETLMAACGVCYSHSVLRIVPCENPERQNRWLNIFTDDIRHILDVHGAVVEESVLHGNEDDAVWVKKAEELYFKSIKGAIVVTESMRRHFANKYSCDNRICFFLIPFLSEAMVCDKETNTSKATRLTVVYAGGVQAWQNILLMQQVVKSQSQLADYYMFVSEPDVFVKLWEKEPIPENVVIKTGNPDEIRKIYRQAHYGFILRDDNIINRIACPAKIMEYIQFGIVPIMKFAEIGDFKTWGLKYWPVEKLMNGELPQEHERALMCKSNLDMVRRAQNEYLRWNEIREYIKNPNRLA